MIIATIVLLLLLSFFFHYPSKNKTLTVDLSRVVFSTAQAIQAASQLRMWVALTSFIVNPQNIPDAIDEAIEALDNAGMVSKNFIGVGHGRGGKTSNC
ncbi:hypothetical protein ElyMa_005404700 [Elysia marginata]|uniref:Uncharacterized protein n=1 Tax=Elysia marginata TaxID=1093978 RepID=A0AAV4EII5_9GAST|nr:hypothetical protein ElyMa_005404700 [Elysia marginata]